MTSMKPGVEGRISVFKWIAVRHVIQQYMVESPEVNATRVICVHLASITNRNQSAYQV
jgi:hypothetical protein